MKMNRLLNAVATAGAIALLMGGSAGAVTLNTMNGSEPGSLDPALASGDWEGRDDLEVSSTEVTDLETVTDPRRLPYPDTWPESAVTPYATPESPCVRLTTDADESDTSAGDDAPTVQLATARTDTVLQTTSDVTRDVTVSTPG